MKNTSFPADTNGEAIEASEPEKKPRPPIIGEEDLPFEESGHSTRELNRMESKGIAAKNLEYQHKMEDKKFHVSVGLLIACFLLVAGFAVWDSCKGTDSSLLTGAFEFAKVVATTVLGYLFASNIKEK